MYSGKCSVVETDETAAVAGWRCPPEARIFGLIQNSRQLVHAHGIIRVHRCHIPRQRMTAAGGIGTGLRRRIGPFQNSGRRWQIPRWRRSLFH